jgi:hypothetical protein
MPGPSPTSAPREDSPDPGIDPLVSFGLDEGPTSYPTPPLPPLTGTVADVAILCGAGESRSGHQRGTGDRALGGG